jgi:predicted RNA binding protein YcfA (HicA-like mRNA interferase family)
VAEDLGWEYQRSRGDHLIYTKPGERHHLSIPDHRSVAPGTLRTLIKTMGLSVDEFLERAKQ